jgi:Uma2 family endonuclease
MGGNMITLPATCPVIYPESDGLPVADNAIQFRWMSVLYTNLRAQYRLRPDVFVGCNQFWYPREGDNRTRTAPDVYVVFGRDKTERSSYLQWQEDNIPLTVAFEIRSPDNTDLDVADKLAFYDEYGVTEYYFFDPDGHELIAYERGLQALKRYPVTTTYVSRQLGIQFDMTGPELVVYRANGKRMTTAEEAEAELSAKENQLTQAEAELSAKENQLTQVKTDLHTTQTTLARLRELSRKARTGQATVEELAELDRLEQVSE